MGTVINSNEQMIAKINEVLRDRKDCVVNIVNDKLTLSVFSMLEKNLKNVKEINFVIRDIRYIPKSGEITREFELDSNPNDMLFNAYDIVEKNKLQHFNKARSMYDFIGTNVNVRKTKPPYEIKSNVLIIDDDFMIQGSSSLELSNKASKARSSSINFDTLMSGTMDKEQILHAKETFHRIWYSHDITEDYKEQLLKSLGYVYKEHSPEFLYYFTLHELFGTQLDYGVERFEQDNTSFKKTKIWNILFDFQKDGVLSAIQKINKYNGCIIADSVGLGKTFEALAVIKYFELRQDNVLVLTPAKLYDNWNSFRGAYKDSILDEVFNYKIMFHTDLSRNKGMSKTGWDLARFDWSKFDLIVIDESHNFRNRTERNDGYTRYQRLLEEARMKNQNTKMLLLSATPVNNSLTDLKNQISLITGDRDDAFREQGIASVDRSLRRTSALINYWAKQPLQNKSKKVLFDNLPSDFYKLLEMLTISRSRKHITTYYRSDEVGTFPTKLKPETHTPNIDTLDKLLNFKETNDLLEQLTLAVYSPMSYIKGKYREYYAEKYQIKTADGRILLTNEVRDYGTKTLHRFNLFKRLESSVYAFSETIRRLLERIDGYIHSLESSSSIASIEAEDDIADEEDVLDYKYEIVLEHLNKEDFLADLYYDKSILVELYKDIQNILENKRDAKLKVLLDVVKNKITETPFNSGNRKVLIFSSFADTTAYLYRELKDELLELGVYTATVSGSNSPRTNNPRVGQDFGSVLAAFSPKSKVRVDVPISEQVDILIGTDCISEGQNLQDCDCVINYDIQWNPVSLIQRFGRIDRIGSKNTQIKMINFFPNLELNEYLNLEQRVKGKMLSVNIASTGDEDILTPEMNDLNFRKRQLERLRDEVVDIDDVNDNISLTDLNMNDYLYELADYIKRVPETELVPRGIYSVTEGNQPGVIFCFKHRNDDSKPKSDSSLYPYYVLYLDNDGSILYGGTQARGVLKEFRKLCYGKGVPIPEVFKRFLSVTNNTKDMSFYSELISRAIESIQGSEESSAEQSVFDFGGFDNPFSNRTEDDFELVSFLVVN